MIRNNAEVEVEIVEVEIRYFFKDRTWFVPSLKKQVRSFIKLFSSIGLSCMIRNNAEVEMVEVEIRYFFKDRTWFVPS